MSRKQIPLPLALVLAVAGPAGLLAWAWAGDVLSTAHHAAAVLGIALASVVWVAALAWCLGGGEAALAVREHRARQRLRQRAAATADH
ncbi:MAG: hypothetical protein RIE31_06590 [Alphaproteobacteria bacterium]